MNQTNNPLPNPIAAPPGNEPAVNPVNQLLARLARLKMRGPKPRTRGAFGGGSRYTREQRAAAKEKAAAS